MFPIAATLHLPQDWMDLKVTQGVGFCMPWLLSTAAAPTETAPAFDRLVSAFVRRSSPPTLSELPLPSSQV